MVVKLEGGEQREVAIEDVAFVVLEHPQITFTHGVMSACIEHGVGLVFCNQQYMPVGMVLSFDGNQTQTQRFRRQAKMSDAVQQKLWEKVVKSKLLNQALLLDSFGFNPQPLMYKAKQVTMGDATNEEAKGARVYWRQLFGRDWQRAREGQAFEHRFI